MAAEDRLKMADRPKMAGTNFLCRPSLAIWDAHGTYECGRMWLTPIFWHQFSLPARLALWDAHGTYGRFGKLGRNLSKPNVAAECGPNVAARMWGGPNVAGTNCLCRPSLAIWDAQGTYGRSGKLGRNLSKPNVAATNFLSRVWLAPIWHQLSLLAQLGNLGCARNLWVTWQARKESKQAECGWHQFSQPNVAGTNFL
jgi:hypothetical protein